MYFKRFDINKILIILGNPSNMFRELKVAISTLKSEVSTLGTSVTSLKTDVQGMRDEMVQMKKAIVEAVNQSARQAVEDCLGENFPRFAAMLDMNRNHQPASEEDKSVENHRLVDDEDDLTEFNKMLARKELFDEYVSLYLFWRPTKKF